MCKFQYVFWDDGSSCTNLYLPEQITRYMIYNQVQMSISCTISLLDRVKCSIAEPWINLIIIIVAPPPVAAMIYIIIQNREYGININDTAPLYELVLYYICDKLL